MKQVMIVAFGAILLASCSSFPKADGTHDCLVIGNIVLDFPDGFFSEQARTIADGIVINIIDLDENRSFSISTNHGFYFFIPEPGHKYKLENFGLMVKTANGNYILGPSPFGLEVNYRSGRVINLEHILITFHAPKQKGGSYIWDSTPSISVESKPHDIRDFIAEMQENSGWLDYDIVDVKYGHDGSSD